MRKKLISNGNVNLDAWDRMRQETKRILAKQRKMGTVIPVDFSSGRMMKAELNNYIKKVAKALGEE